MRKTFLTLASALVLAACSSGGGTSAEADKVREAISAAEKENDKAAEMGFEWRDARKFIKEAREELDKGNTDKAMELAREAEFQGEQGQKQAQTQANASPEPQMEDEDIN
ncbi:hypothetical protein [Thiohalospira sp.]|uniref:hypothetical protein n=1 Tax=Thiohalospira sp. TaxID=3080549 RepID=UPI00397F8F0E